MKLADQVRSRLVANKSQATQEGVVAALRDEGIVLGDGAILSLITELQREFTGVGILEPLLQQADVTDILVNGPSQIWIGTRATHLWFGSRSACVGSASSQCSWSQT